MKIYAGNLSSEVKDEDLRQAFEKFGKVDSATIMNDKQSGQPRGFGIVEMSSPDEGKSAIAGLNGKKFQGKEMTVNEVSSRADRRGKNKGFQGRGGGNSGGGFGSGKSGYSGGGGGFSGRKGGQARGR